MKLTFFQLALFGLFLLLAIIGVMVFAARGGLGGSGSVGKVIVWGTLNQNMVDSMLSDLRQQDKSLQNVVYKQQKEDGHTVELINAMASGAGPDLVLLSQEDIFSFRDKVATIPYTAVSQQTFINSFVSEGQLFLTTNGSLALPFLVDPMVMYWNQDMFNSAGVAQPPRYWNELLDIAPRITTLDANNNVKKSAVALGEWSNIAHAKQLLSALFLQAGDPIVSRDSDGTVIVVFGVTPQSASENPAASALQFYTEFVNPTKTIYSWNRALPNSLKAFESGDVAIYFGFASDYSVIKASNPNLRFAVAQLPQLKGNSIQSTYGTLWGFAIPRTATNLSGALAVAQKLTNQDAAAIIAPKSMLPSARRDVSIGTEANAVAATFQQSSLMASGWTEPEPSKTDDIFATMIQSVVSGKATPGEAVSQAAQALSALIPTIQ
jgi:multiple sugar transport system substrate-binding protein